MAASEPADSDQHYAGAPVDLGDADAPVFWYRPEGSETYRVIYGDLTVGDAGGNELPSARSRAPQGPRWTIVDSPVWLTSLEVRVLSVLGGMGRPRSPASEVCPWTCVNTPATTGRT